MTSDRDPHRIDSVEALRRVLRDPNPATKSKVLDHIDDQGRAFLAEATFLLLSTASRDGAIEVSPKGDAPGFVQLEDERTALIPDRAGNKLAFGLTNLIENPRIGAIVLRAGTGETLRFGGTAEIRSDPPLLERLSARGRPAVLAIRVHIERAYFHCARSVLRAELWDPDCWPARQTVSFGRILQAQTGQGDAATAAQIDQSVERAYREEL